MSWLRDKYEITTVVMSHGEIVSHPFDIGILSLLDTGWLNISPVWLNHWLIKSPVWHNDITYVIRESSVWHGNIISILNLTHWGRVTHICVSRLTITCSDNGLSPGRRQAIIWTNAGILLIGALGTNFSENSIEILAFLFTKMRLKVSSAKWRPFCLGLNVLIFHEYDTMTSWHRNVFRSLPSVERNHQSSVNAPHISY